MRFVSLYYHLSCSSYREVLELVWAYSRRKAGDEQRERGSRRGLQNVDQVRGSNSLVVERGWERRVGTSTTGYPRGFAEAAEPADKSSLLLDEENLEKLKFLGVDRPPTLSLFHESLRDQSSSHTLVIRNRFNTL